MDEINDPGSYRRAELKEMAAKLKELAAKPTFREKVTEMANLYEKKNKDYGDSFHETCKEYGLYAATMRLHDKLSRAKQLLKNGEQEIKTESVVDTLTDLACYAIMLCLEVEKGGKQ
jgi:hypothetical protein